jgi:hypothetical protein
MKTNIFLFKDNLLNTNGKFLSYFTKKKTIIECKEIKIFVRNFLLFRHNMSPETAVII